MRPNIVLFMPDQLRADALGCFGNDIAHTPHVDALAARGARFADAWSQHSVCGPSRVSIMTGWYPHVGGHRTLDNLLKPWEPNLLRLLRDAGYAVAMPGHRGDVFAPGVTEASTDFCGFFEPPAPGAAARRYRPHHGDDHRLTRAFWFGPGGDELCVDFDEATIRTTERWLSEYAPRDQPWALWVPLMFPHPPFTVEEPWFSQHDRRAVPLPIAATAGRGKPAFMDAYRAAYGWDELSDDDRREIVATYYGMVSRVDWQLGRVLEAVDRIGATDRTAVVFLTDHGEYLGDFGLVEKWPSGLDPCLTRNPLVVAGPGVKEGTTVDALVELVDVLATCCEWAEADVGHTHFGRSLTPLLGGSAARHRDAAYCEGGFRRTDAALLERAGWVYQPKSDLQHARPELVGLAIARRTERHTYVWRVEEPEELYDRVRDPCETTNIASGAPEIVREMRDATFRWLATTSDVVPWVADPRFPEIPHGPRGSS